MLYLADETAAEMLGKNDNDSSVCHERDICLPGLIEKTPTKILDEFIRKKKSLLTLDVLRLTSGPIKSEYISQDVTSIAARVGFCSLPLATSSSGGKGMK